MGVSIVQFYAKILDAAMPMMILFFRNADRILRAEKYRSVQKLVSPLLDLELVRIHSVCSEHYLTFLLQQCINVKEISLGMMTEISDKVWSDVLAKNSLAKLEKISCQKCTKVPSTLKIYENSAKNAGKKL